MKFKQAAFMVVCFVLCAGVLPAGDRFEVERRIIYPDEFKAGKPYSPGVLVGETLYISGQIDRDPQTGEQPEGIVDQTKMAMDNMGHVLRAAGMDYSNVVSCHVQLADMGNYKPMNETYGGYFGPDHYPARTTLEMPGLPGGSHLEVSCIAYADKSKIKILIPPAGSIPTAMGPYRPGVWAGDTLYVSGSGGRNPKTNKVPESIEEQTKQTMETIGNILKAGGLKHEDAVFVNVYFLDPEGYQGPTYGKLNSVYKDSFPIGTAPSRASFALSNASRNDQRRDHLHRHARSGQQGPGSARFAGHQPHVLQRRRSFRTNPLDVGKIRQGRNAHRADDRLDRGHSRHSPPRWNGS